MRALQTPWTGAAWSPANSIRNTFHPTRLESCGLITKAFSRACKYRTHFRLHHGLTAHTTLHAAPCLYAIQVGDGSPVPVGRCLAWELLIGFSLGRRGAGKSVKTAGEGTLSAGTKRKKGCWACGSLQLTNSIDLTSLLAREFVITLCSHGSAIAFCESVTFAFRGEQPLIAENDSNGDHYENTKKCQKFTLSPNLLALTSVTVSSTTKPPFLVFA